MIILSIAIYMPQVRWAGDRCTVCDSDVDFDFDQLVSCEQCGITVHQTCYGVPELPGEDDLWLCRSCEFKVPMPSFSLTPCPICGCAAPASSKAPMPFFSIIPPAQFVAVQLMQEFKAPCPPA